MKPPMTRTRLPLALATATLLLAAGGIAQADDGPGVPPGTEATPSAPWTWIPTTLI